MSTESIQLEGTRDQVKELARAVNSYKTTLFALGGDNAAVDMAIEERISQLSYWDQLIQLKLQQ